MEMIDKDFMRTFMATAKRRARAKKFMISSRPIPIDPYPQEIMSENFVKRLYEEVEEEEF